MCYIFSKNRPFSLGPNVISPIRSLLWMYPLLPLSYFFLKWGINNFWTVLKVENPNGRHKVEWLFTLMLAHAATCKALYVQQRCSLHS